LSLDYIKQLLVGLEGFYTDNSAMMKREWDLEEDREKIINKLLSAENVEGVRDAMLELEKGFSDPFILRFDMKSRIVIQDSDEEMKGSNEEEIKKPLIHEMPNPKNKTGADGIVRMKFPNMKFWSLTENQESWVHLTSEVISLPALYLSYKILEKSTTDFINKSVSNLEKKN
jgi:hypothetical protein